MHKSARVREYKEAEVDFILDCEEGVFPLEVKAGVNKKKKSLQEYDKKYSPSALLRSTLMNLRHDGNIKNYPLYMVSRFSSIS